MLHIYFTENHFLLPFDSTGNILGLNPFSASNSGFWIYASKVMLLSINASNGPLISAALVTMARSKIISRSDHDAAHLHPLTNVSTKYQLPTPYGFRDIARTRFSNSRSLRQSQRSNEGQAMTLHTYTP